MIVRSIRDLCSSPKSRPVAVGWMLKTNRASLIWHDPHPVYETGGPTPSTQTPARDAAFDDGSRLVQIDCPFTVRLRVESTADGTWQLKDLDGERSSIMPSALAEVALLSERKQWRRDDWPILQITTPYTFVADESVYISPLPPFLHYRSTPWPGLVIGGRFPVHVWPRTLAWAFEWHDVDRELVLKRGEPWFYCRVETMDPSRKVSLFEAERTSELVNYVEGLSGVTAYINGTFGLFETARRRRPERLLVERRCPRQK